MTPAGENYTRGYIAGLDGLIQTLDDLDAEPKFHHTNCDLEQILRDWVRDFKAAIQATSSLTPQQRAALTKTLENRR